MLGYGLLLWKIFHILYQINLNEETSGTDSDRVPWSRSFHSYRDVGIWTITTMEHIFAADNLWKSNYSCLAATTANFSNLLRNRVTFFLEAICSLANNSDLRFSASPCASVHLQAWNHLSLGKAQSPFYCTMAVLATQLCSGQRFCSLKPQLQSCEVGVDSSLMC